MTEYPATYTEALVRLQAKLPEVKKDQKATVKMKAGGEYDYKYAGMARVSSAILPLLAEHGLAFNARPTLNAEGKFVLAYKMRHVSGEWEDGEYPLRTDLTPQLTGAMITYARRHALCAVTGLAPEEDDDDAAAAEEQAQRASGPVRRRQQAKPQQNRAGRTVQRRQQDDDLPPLPGEETAPRARSKQPGSAENGQLAAIWMHLQRLGFDRETEHKQAHGVIATLARRDLTGPREDGVSSKNLSEAEAAAVGSELGRLKDRAALVARLAKLKESADD